MRSSGRPLTLSPYIFINSGEGDLGRRKREEKFVQFPHNTIIFPNTLRERKGKEGKKGGEKKPLPASFLPYLIKKKGREGTPTNPISCTCGPIQGAIKKSHGIPSRLLR